LNEKLKGFYRSVYQLPSGEQKYAAVTQFEAIDARRAFPCWDEPSLKATFEVRIIAEADRTVVSNTVNFYDLHFLIRLISTYFSL
jgi:puromycin-sensitive aminopeptidase